MIYILCNTFTSSCGNSNQLSITSKEQVDFICLLLHRYLHVTPNVAEFRIVYINLQLFQLSRCPVCVASCESSKCTNFTLLSHMTSQVWIQPPYKKTSLFFYFFLFIALSNAIFYVCKFTYHKSVYNILIHLCAITLTMCNYWNEWTDIRNAISVYCSPSGYRYWRWRKRWDLFSSFN